MAYKFCDINQAPSNEEALTMEFNGVNLDHRFRGHLETLNVTGRGLLAPEVRFTERIGNAGAWLDSAELPYRIISAEMRLEHDNLRALFNELNAVLYTKTPQKLVFSDEGEFYFNALFESVEEGKEDNKMQTLVLNFICLDPYKYKKWEASIKGNSSVKFNKELIWPAAVKKIVVSKPSSGQLTLKIDKTGRRLILDDLPAFPLGNSKITFDFDEGSINSSVGNLLPNLSLQSDFEGLSLPSGATVECSQAGVYLEVFYQERLL